MCVRLALAQSWHVCVLLVRLCAEWGGRVSYCVLKAPLTDMLCWSEWVCMSLACTCVRVCVAWRWVTILWLPPGLTERIQGSPGWGHHAQVKVLYLGPGKPANLLQTSYLPACRPLASHIAPHHTSGTHQHTRTQAGRQLRKRGTQIILYRIAQGNPLLWHVALEQVSKPGLTLVYRLCWFSENNR